MAVLFVGNGINLNEGISVSWDELLKEICSESTEDISHALGSYEEKYAEAVDLLAGCLADIKEEENK